MTGGGTGGGRGGWPRRVAVAARYTCSRGPGTIIHSKGDAQTAHGDYASYIQKEMQRLHTETTRSSDYLLQTVLLLYFIRPDAAPCCPLRIEMHRAISPRQLSQS